MHHAVQAGDVGDDPSPSGPRPAARRRAPDSHRQALAHFEARPASTWTSSRRPGALACSTTSAGSSITRTGSARRSAQGAPRSACTASSATSRPWDAGSVRLSRHLYMAGETDEVGGVDLLGGRDPRAHRSGRRARPCRALSRRNPRHDRRPRAGGQGARARPPARARRRAGRPGGAVLQLRGGGARRDRRRRRRAADAREHRGGDGRAPVRVRRRAATRTWPSCCCAPTAWRSCRGASTKGCASRASAASGRTRTTSRCTAARCGCGAATGTARSPGCARRSPPRPTRGCCSRTARHGWGAC